MFTAYVIYSEKFDKIYVGFTSNIEARLHSHNSSKNTGWTKSFQPWVLFYKETYPTKKEAMAREKSLKSYRGREFIRSLIPKKE